MDIKDINKLIKAIEQRLSEDEKDISSEPTLQAEYFISKIKEDPNIKKAYLDGIYDLLPENDAVIEILKELQGELPTVDTRIPALITRFNTLTKQYEKLIKAIEQT